MTRITDRGREVLQANPERIDIGILEQFDEFQEFRNASSDDDEAAAATSADVANTPEEAIEAAFTTLNDALASELRDKLITTSPEFFEQVVIDVLTAMGYGGSRKEAGERLGRSGDAGIDGVIREDTLGLDAIYLKPNAGTPPMPSADPTSRRSSVRSTGPGHPRACSSPHRGSHKKPVTTRKASTLASC